MSETNYTAVTQAFIGELRAVVNSGVEVVSRGLVSRELQARLVRIREPRQRVLLVPNRNNNIFATVAETMWVLAGRNDLGFLARYLPRAADFSDDGLVWRAGYGPRLRNWHGVDQLYEVVRTLQADPSSRRAVITLFDPAADNIASRDIPCNNWLHAFIRQDQLHLSVAVRSNDIIWGFSGINVFEWTVLQDMLAYWTGKKVGNMSYFVSSLHLYERHYSRATRILAENRTKTLYDFGFMSPTFSTPIETLDTRLEAWFAAEDRMRCGHGTDPIDWGQEPDDLLRTSLQLMWIYNRYLDGAERAEIAELLGDLPESDLKVAAIEYLARAFRDTEFVKLTPREASYLAYFWGDTLMEGKLTFEQIFHILGELHNKKTLVYGDSWKKHGEVLGVFANITRKYDRLERMLAMPYTKLSNESLVDTLADLVIYGTKYLTFLAEHHAHAFAEFASSILEVEPVSAYQGNDGFDAVARLLAKRSMLELTELSGADRDTSIHRIRSAYTALEGMLVGMPYPTANVRQRIIAASDLVISATHYLMAHSSEQPETFEHFKRQVGEL